MSMQRVDMTVSLFLVDPKSSDKNLGIKLDFIDEVNSLSYKKFEKIVFELGQKAIETLLTHKMS